jgi:hypothetical protein
VRKEVRQSVREDILAQIEIKKQTTQDPNPDALTFEDLLANAEKNPIKTYRTSRMLLPKSRSAIDL